MFVSRGLGDLRERNNNNNKNVHINVYTLNVILGRVSDICRDMTHKAQTIVI